MLPYIFPGSSDLDATTGTIELQVHSTTLSDLTPNQEFESNNSILRSLSPDIPTITLQYWITTRSILLTFMQDQQEAGYSVLYFTPFFTKEAWTRL